MKIRTDFVTNSSSSSFILGFKDEEDMTKVLKAEISRRKASYRNELIEEIPDSLHSFDEVIAYCKEEVGNDVDWDIYEKFFDEYRGGADSWKLWDEYRNGEEYKKRLEEKTNKIVDKIASELKDKPYIAIVEHGDGGEGEDGVLEHDILPKLSCTVKRFSHH